MKVRIRNTVLSAFCVTALMYSSTTLAQNGFVVRDIKVEGLQRVSRGTVLNYLPVQVGEEVSAKSTPGIIRALYNTGFFRSVVLERRGNALVVKVVERPTIGSVTISGNKELPTDKLKELMKELGLAKGRVYKRASLERLEKELMQAYNARGKYNAHVDTKVSDLTENRVGISVHISEGRVSRIKEIKIIGNHDFSEGELKSVLTLSSSNIFTYFSKRDQYNKPSMDASLEALRSFYLDRGYLKFQIVSSQVLVSPDKKNVYIVINVSEGPQYHFSGFSVSGRTILPKQKIEALIPIHKGDVFSRKKITGAISAIGEALGNVGYGFPAVNAEPKVDEKNKTVFINFAIEPGRHVYVHRLNFHGNTKTADYVLRSIVKQDEGSLLTLQKVKESERQLKNINYLKNTRVKTTPTPNANNQVDVDVDVEEAPSSEASASLGYGTNGPQFNATFNQFNFLGTGRTVGLAFNASYWGQDYSFNFYNPFYTSTGIGRGFNLYYQAVDPKHLDVATYSNDKLGGDLNYNFILSDFSAAQLGMGYQNLAIKNVGYITQIVNFSDIHGMNFNQGRINGGWNRITYNKSIYPTCGSNQQASFLVAFPLTSRSLEYYKLTYQARTYVPLFKGFVFTALGNVSYGNSFDSQGLPFFENYFAGGNIMPGQVRGYESYSLGPHDNFGNSLGGNLMVNGSVGVFFPYPLTQDTFRTGVFIDAGNAFSYQTPVPLRGTDAGPLRFSGGLSVEWRSPMGPLAFSVAEPINPQPTDRKNIFQFSLSSSF